MWIREKMTMEISKKMGINNKLRRRIYRHMLLSPLSHSTFDVGRSMFDVHLFQLTFHNTLAKK